jgi:hypothetical protein
MVSPGSNLSWCTRVIARLVALRLRRLSVVILLVAACGVGVAVLADTFANVLVNNPAADTTPNDTQSETTVALLGNTVLVGFNDSGSFAATGNRFTGYAQSTDGGLTFTDMGLLPTGSIGDAGDPYIAVDSTNGRFYFASIQFNTPSINVLRSTDGGVTWGAGQLPAPGGTLGSDFPALAVDNFSGTQQGTLYGLARHGIGPSVGNFLYRSTDGGATFGSAVPVTPPFGVGAGRVAVGPDHAIYVSWWQSATQQFLGPGQQVQLRKSTDGGLTFGAPSTVANLVTTGTLGDLGLTGVRVNTGTPALFRTPLVPQTAANSANGNIYVAYHDKGTFPDRANVFFKHSTDGGVTWGAPVRINADATTADQWQPSLAVTPDGTHVGVFWYDRRLDPGNNLIDYFGRIGAVSGSTVTFGPDFRITDQSFFPEFGREPNVNPFYMGDYDHAAADNAYFYVAWGDNRDPSVVVPTRKQANVRFAKIPIATAPSFEGCGPGFWGQSRRITLWNTYQPSDDFDTTFGTAFFNPDITLQQAVQLKGGGINALARQAVAALLNTVAGPSLTYQYTTAQVMDIVSGSGAYSGLTVGARTDLLKAANETSCPLP